MLDYPPTLAALGVWPAGFELGALRGGLGQFVGACGLGVKLVFGLGLGRELGLSRLKLRLKAGNDEPIEPVEGGKGLWIKSVVALRRAIPYRSPDTEVPFKKSC